MTETKKAVPGALLAGSEEGPQCDPLGAEEREDVRNEGEGGVEAAVEGQSDGGDRPARFLAH